MPASLGAAEAMSDRNSSVGIPPLWGRVLARDRRKGPGAVLAQKQEDGSTQPIAYASRTLEVSEKKYGVTEVEALAVVWTVKHFQHYLYGHCCHVYTDHETPKSLMNTPYPSECLARWVLALQEVDLHIH